MIERLEWTEIPDAAAEELATRALYGEDTDFDKLDEIRVTGTSADLSFYPQLGFFHIVIAPQEGAVIDLFVLANSEHAYLLDGTSAPVHDANLAEGIEITEATAADYLRFFCFAVRGTEGPFLLFEEARVVDDEAASGIAALAAPIRADGRDDDGDFVFHVPVVYGGALFRSSFAVSESGNTTMLDDEPVAADVSPAVLQPVPDLVPRATVVARLESAGAVEMTGATILRILIELLLESALTQQAQVRLLSHFNARQKGGSTVERFVRLLTTSAPVVCIESALPFVEETVAQIARENVANQRSVRWIRPDVDHNDDTLLRVSVSGSVPAVVVLSFHSYRGIVDAERFAHDVASSEISCLIGCDRVGDLPESLRQVVDLTLTLPRLDAPLFSSLFRRVMRSDPPKDWQGADPHWITHVHHSDFQQPKALGLQPQEAIDYIRERAVNRLRDVEPVGGLGIKSLHGLGEARVFAEDLIGDIHEAIKGRLEWRDVDRGVLLYGAPGTGKTTLARAIAKDCGIRFVNASAASWQAAGYLGDHIRAMRADFAQARRFAPAILFIDEIDSVGNRESFSGKNAQYSTQVVNALLELIQGLDPKAPVIIVAATNHRDNVDPALRRAGRLDREIEIPRPNTEALAQIFRHYLNAYEPAELDADIDVKDLGGLSLGRTGADVELFVRGAARRARKAGRRICQADLLAEVTSKPRDPGSMPAMTPAELRRVAVHEAGHALASYLTGTRGEQIGFVSVVPRADGSLGFVAHLASNRVLLTRSEYLEALEIILAGRAAEEVIFGEQGISGGAGGSSRTSDLAAATRGALQLVSQGGLGPEQSLLWSESPGPAQVKQAEEILNQSYRSVLARIWQQHDALVRLADALVEHQELTGDQIRSLLAGNGAPAA